MGNIQDAVDRKKRERSDERLREAGIDPGEYVRNDWKIPDFENGGISTNFFISPLMTKGYIAKHIDDKFSVDGRPRMSFRERMDIPAYSPDSVRAMTSEDSWRSAKRLLKAIITDNTDELKKMAGEMLKRGGVFRGKGKRIC